MTIGLYCVVAVCLAYLWASGHDSARTLGVVAIVLIGALDGLLLSSIVSLRPDDRA